jgi:murein DD-endopeptidase MepM/ murein hydrolase activator NlpD
MHQKLATILLITALTACTSAVVTPAPYATITPVLGTAPTVIPATLTVETPQLAPTPADLPEAMLTLPDSTGATIGCAANTIRARMNLPDGTPIGAVSRLAESGGYLYMLADGGLYRTGLLDAGIGHPLLEAIALPGMDIGGRPIQELADIDAGSNGHIVMLDKAGHVFAFDPAVNAFSLLFRASRDQVVEGQTSQQTVAVTVGKDGEVFVLDVGEGEIQEVRNQNTLAPVSASKGLTASADITMANGQFMTLQNNGTLRVVSAEDGTRLWQDSEGRRLGLSIKVSEHLGAPLILVIDAERREIDGLLPGSIQVTRHVFAMPDLGLLRDAVYAGGRLFAVADADLLVYPGNASEAASASCQTPPGPEYFQQPRLYGGDVLALLQGIHPPVPNGTLSSYDHAYPGANRLYRLGVHRGTDFYGYGMGDPVFAVRGGMVAEASLNYLPLTTGDWDRLTIDAEKRGQTPPDVLDRLEGRQVTIDHGQGIRTVYAHLDAITEGIGPGVTVTEGTPIGAVGVSGTSAESDPGTEQPHLHFEVWIGSRYLGYGITIRETMWWLAGMFEEPS